MKSSYQLTDRAALLTISGDSGAAHPQVAVIPMETVAKSVAFAPQFAALANVFPVLADQIAAANERLQPNARAEDLRGMVSRTVGKPYQAAQAAVIAEASAAKASRGVAMAYRAGDPVFFPMIVAKFAAMPAAQRAAFAERASVEQTSALVAAGRDFFDGVDDNIWQVVERRHIIQAHIRITGLQADHQLQPNAANPAASGPDVPGVEKAAAEALKRHEARGEVVAAAEGSLRSIVAAVALATDLSHDAAYDLLTGKAA
ncbi:hypothetical protein [Mesorhizobium sp. M0619]|uniref:hypothetical protein n=1 Tax=unclassified Mesorhizobium TaxID=325217 RepID=UPI00333BE019